MGERALRRPRGARGGRWAGLIALLVLVWAAPAGAEIRSLEVLGVLPMDEQARKGGIPKDEAIAAALWEGVSRVAEELLIDSVIEEPEDGSDPIRAALGSDMLPYTQRFRIVEDRGERPALFADSDDGAATEYVVVVDVRVDVERVRQRLIGAGLLSIEEGAPGRRIVMEVQGLTRYPGYARLVEALRAPGIGAGRVVPLEFERGRIVLDVQVELEAAELIRRLKAAAPSELGVTALYIGRPTQPASDEPDAGSTPLATERVVVRVDWTPPPPEDGDDPALADQAG